MGIRFKVILILFVNLIFVSCRDDEDPVSGGNPSSPDITSVSFSITSAFPNLQFDQPLFLTHAGDGTDRIFIVERRGRILVFPNDPEVSQFDVFLDLSAQVTTGFFEQGLLGLAFHPQYGENGRFYVNYTGTDGATTVASYQVTTDPNQADPSGEIALLKIAQPFSNHNGGMIAFGPDGYLYIGMGDGGSGGDPLGSGQDLTTLLGAVLRINVDDASSGKLYGIPPDNLFVGNSQGYKEEIFAYGLRNPWRFSFDLVSGNMWAADVGQDRIEEVDIVENGGNYGWNIMEGKECFISSVCDQQNLTLPVAEYGHGIGQSVTGGYVYRGTELTALVGYYIYSDFITGRIFVLDTESPDSEAQILAIQQDGISSFGLDQQENLFLIDFNTGRILTIAQSAGN